MDNWLTGPLMPPLPGAAAAMGADTAIIVAVVSAFATVFAILFGTRVAYRIQQSGGGLVGDLLPEGISFLFSGSRVWMATNDAHRLLLEGGVQGSDRDALVAALSKRGSDIGRRLRLLMDDGIPFRVEAPQSDGTVWLVEGQPRGAMTGIQIRDLTVEQKQIRDLKATLDKLSHEREQCGMLLNAAPFAAWHQGASGDLRWANDAYHRLAKSTGSDDAGMLTQAAGDVARNGKGRLRMDAPDGPGTVWLDVVARAAPDGGKAIFALPADKIVATEDALHRFVGTLTETFAHISVGLAIFDENRRLHLFNPALSDMLGIDPGWLAVRPTMRDFLDRLRELQIMPEQPNFEQCRATMARLEAAATAGNLSEQWLLPTGRTYQISGRPHPKNAVALMIEDITDSVAHERRYKSEIELSQTALECINESVAIFDLAGKLTFANQAFQTLWDMPDRWPEEPPSIRMLTDHCASRCEENTLWATLRDFATGQAQRTGWTASVTLADGRVTHGRIEPMPNGSTLLVFGGVAEGDAVRSALLAQKDCLSQAAKAERVQVDWAADLFREALMEAVQQVGVQSPLGSELLRTLQEGDAAIALSHQEDPQTNDALENLHAQLSSLVSPQGHSVDLEFDGNLDASDLPAHLRQGLLGLLSAVKTVAVPGSRLGLYVSKADDGVQITATTNQAVANANDQVERANNILPLRILSRIAGGSGNDIKRFRSLDGGVGLSVHFPDDITSDETRITAS